MTMGNRDDLRLRFWITLAKRAILVVDDFLPVLRRLHPGGAPVAALRNHPYIESCRIPVAHGSLDARFCAPAKPVAAIVICHGIGDRLSYWQNVQLLLERYGIATLIFDYASYGASTGSLSVKTLREDTRAAYAELRSRLPGVPLFLLGFSMGTGVAADAVSSIDIAPAGIILCQPFTSLRAGAGEIVRWRPLTRLLPDVWDTAASLRSLKVPLLIVHGDADRLFPLRHARDLHSVAPAASALSTPAGFGHPHGYLTPTLAYWQPVLDFIAANMD